MEYFPEELFENVVNSITLWVGDKKLVVDLNEPLVALVSRLEIGQYQLKLAKEAGAQVLASTPVKGLDREKNEVILNDERIGYNIS